MKFLHLVTFIGFAGSLVQANAIPHPGGDDSSLEARDDHDHHASHRHGSDLTESRDMGLDDEKNEHYHIKARDENAQLQARVITKPKKKPSPKQKPAKQKPAKAPKPKLPPKVGPTAKKAPISSVAVAQTQLGGLTVRAANAVLPTGFGRASFSHWAGEQGCSARETVLKRDATTL